MTNKSEKFRQIVNNLQTDSTNCLDFDDFGLSDSYWNELLKILEGPEGAKCGCLRLSGNILGLFFLSFLSFSNSSHASGNNLGNEKVIQLCQFLMKKQNCISKLGLSSNCD